MDEDNLQPIEMWSRKYPRYIRERRPMLYIALLLSGNLNGLFAELDSWAVLIFVRLVKQLAAKEGH